MSIPTNGKENKYPHLPRMNQLCIASRNCLYRLAYSESLSTQVAEAMLLQHRETDRRQPGGRPRARSSRVVPAIHGRIVEGESGSFSSAGGTISKNTCSTYPSETQTKTGFFNTAKKSSKRLHWMCLERGGAAGVWTKCVTSTILHSKPRSSSSIPCQTCKVHRISQL